MRRYLFCVIVLIPTCLMLPARVSAQQTGGSTRDNGTGDTSGSGSAGLTVEGPRMMTGEEIRAMAEPGQVIGGTGAGAGFLRGTAEAATQTGRGTTGTTGRQQGRVNNFNNLRNVMNNFGMFNSMFNQQRQVRVPITLGFTPAFQTPPPLVANRVQDRLARIPQLRDNGPITVEMDGRVAVLRGGVVSTDERELVARLVLLEPGISGVRNELQVTPPVPAPPEPGTP
jgi:hypothetical protein